MRFSLLIHGVTRALHASCDPELQRKRDAEWPPVYELDRNDGWNSVSCSTSSLASETWWAVEGAEIANNSAHGALDDDLCRGWLKHFASELQHLQPLCIIEESQHEHSIGLFQRYQCQVGVKSAASRDAASDKSTPVCFPSLGCSCACFSGCGCCVETLQHRRPPGATGFLPMASLQIRRKPQPHA